MRPWFRCPSRCGLLALLLLATGCGDASPTAVGGSSQSGTGTSADPPPAAHDFGMIPHGESRSHDFVLDPRTLGVDCVPLRAQLDCSCARGQLLLRHKNGAERLLDGTPFAGNAPTADEVLVARVRIDTITKDAVDLPITTSRGYVVLQPTHDRDGSLRRSWPLLLRFGIESPVVLRPFAALDFGTVARSETPTIVTTLAGDERHANVRFGPAESSDPAIEVSLEPEGGRVVVRARCRPAGEGSHRAVVAIGTDLASGYRVHLGVTWKVVPDLVALPMGKLSFRANLGRAQTVAEGQAQYLLVADHDLRRAVEFRVHEVVTQDGQDARDSFAITFEPVPGKPRQQRMFVRYLGGRPDGFRGRIVLTKDGANGPFLPIELVVFAAKDS